MFFLFPASNPHIFFTAQLFNMCCMSSQGGQWRRPCNFWKPDFMSLPWVWSDNYLSIFELFSFFELFWTFLNFYQLQAGRACAAGFLPGVSSDDCTTHFVWLFNFSTREFIELIGFIVFFCFFFNFTYFCSSYLQFHFWPHGTYLDVAVSSKNWFYLFVPNSSKSIHFSFT